MSLTPAGLTNAIAVYSQHYLDDILECDLKALFDLWKEQAGQSPAARLRSAGVAAYFRARERFLATLFRAECERVILPQGCETAEDYMRVSRIGRGCQLGPATRKAIWPVFAEYRAQLNGANLREPEEAFRDARNLLQDPGAALGIRCMIVDEAQDISAAAFTLIRAAVPPAENDLFIVGDAHQWVYRHKVVLGRVGIEVRAGVRLATMHRIKGLEFGVLILAGYESPQSYAEAFLKDADADVNDDTETAERCLLHVAATRAKGHLFVLKRDSE